MTENIESIRLLSELALISGKKRKSLQTGYLHLCHHPVEPEIHLSIPLVENFLFALALLKSKTIENIQEAKTMIEGLLYFQNTNPEEPSKGNFPIYIHDFPTCKDRFTGIQVACALFWILKLFHQVIGQDLKKRLEESFILAIKHALKACIEKKTPYPMAVKIATAAAAGGLLIQNHQLKDDGWKMLEALRNNPDEACWFCPAAMGSIAVSLYVVYPKLQDSPWKFFWDHLQATWHRQTTSYSGPSLKEWQKAEEPQVTLYDLICGYLSDAFSDRALKDSPVHLEGVLIPHLDECFEKLQYPFQLHGVIKGAKWFMHQDEKLAYSYIEKGTIQIDQMYEKGFHPFKLLWGDHHRVHTFVCQGGNATSISFDGTDFIFDLEGPCELEDRDNNREIIFFIDAHDEMEFLVCGHKSSTFRLDEEVSIKDRFLTLSLTFHLEAGQGRFLGHRMLGNRPAQLDRKDRFNAYDWQVFLRTVGREDKCRLKVRVINQSDI